jgi:hypothetical protein
MFKIDANCVLRDGNEIQKVHDTELKKIAAPLFWNYVVSKQIAVPPH